MSLRNLANVADEKRCERREYAKMRVLQGRLDESLHGRVGIVMSNTGFKEQAALEVSHGAFR